MKTKPESASTDNDITYPLLGQSQDTNSGGQKQRHSLSQSFRLPIAFCLAVDDGIDLLPGRFMSVSGG